MPTDPRSRLEFSLAIRPVTGELQFEVSPGRMDRRYWVALQPGDVIKFKGGVHYLGEIQLRDLKGTENNPIRFDGNSDGQYGEGPAILDGARLINDWKFVDSAEQVDGNPKWRKIMYADLDVVPPPPVEWSR